MTNPFWRIPAGQLARLGFRLECGEKSCRLLTESAHSPLMRKPVPASFGEKLKAFRGPRTAATVAAALGVPYTTWRNWEVNHQTPPPYVQMAILESLRTLKPEPPKAKAA